MNDTINYSMRMGLSVIVALISLLFYALIPTHNLFQEIVSSVSFFLVIPLLYGKIVLKERLESFGLRVGNWKRGILWMLFGTVASLLVFYLIFRYSSFAQKYSMPHLATGSFWTFIVYELFLIGSFTALYEFFFRGFLMLSLAERLKYWAILAQSIVFIAFFIIVKNLDWAIIQFMIAAPFSGIVAYRSRSIIYSFAATLLFIVLADALVIGLAR